MLESNMSNTVDDAATRENVSDNDGKTSSPRRFWLRHIEEPPTEILPSDHPLMTRFQAALKNHLQRQNERLTKEVLELDGGIKKGNRQRDELDYTLRNMQQGVSKQKNQLVNFHESLSHTIKLRQDMEQKAEESKTLYLVESEKLKSAQKKEEELRSELMSLMMLEKQFTDWEAEMESELAVSQRISEKTKLDKRKLAEEKRKQDIFILKLTSEVANLETQIINLDGQFKIKEVERLTISQTLADANADLEALGKEQHRLLQAWNGVVVSMQQRDKAYAAVMEEQKNLQEKFLSLNQEIEGYRRCSNDEMQKNEKLTAIMQKLTTELASVERMIGISNEKKAALEAQLVSNTAMLEETEKTLEATINDGKKCSYDLAILYRELEKLLTGKTDLEDEILEKMQDQVSQDKAAKSLNASIRELREKTRNQEITVTTTENQLTQTELELERQKGELLRGEHLLEDVRAELLEQEKQFAEATATLTTCKSNVNKRQTTVDIFNKQLELLIDKAGGVEMSPYQLKIYSLQTAIDETEQKSEQLQQTWLRQQNKIVNLSKQRNELHHQLNILRKQLVILDQKNLTIEEEIENFNKQERDMCRSISTLLSKLDGLNQKLSHHKDYKEALDKENVLMQTDYINILKDMERKTIQLEEQISDLIKEKNQLSEHLMDVQRESLAWEKKLQMAVETKQNIDKERGKEGEMGAMRIEIHRMEVRYTQLCRAQEKLVQDLEYCVLRREAFVDGADAKEKRSVKTLHNTQVSFQKKLDALHTKIKQINAEIKSAERTISNRNKQQADILERLSEKQSQLKQLQEVSNEVDRQLQEGQLLKQKNLELLVRRQRRAKMYGDVKSGRHRLLYRSEHALDAEMQRQQTITTDLISVVESLLTDFPALYFPLTKILNTLRLLP